jgi:hypothetical protein
MEQRHKDYPDEPTLSSYEDLLLFTLFSLKSGLSFDLPGLTTGMDGSTCESGLAGENHDYRPLKYHFPPDQPWFSDLTIELDLGYQGVTKEYDCQSVSQPLKKPKGGNPTAEEKESNRQKSSSRIKIEHAIGGLKRYRYLSDRLRTHKVLLYELSILICAGLWNFILTN